MRIETAHKILIVSAVAFFAFFGALETARFLKGHEASAGVMAAGGFAAAGLFAIYLRGYLRRLREDHAPEQTP